MTKRSSFGTSMGGVEKSPDRKRREHERRRRQNKRWTDRAGEVRILTVEDLPPTSQLNPPQIE